MAPKPIVPIAGSLFPVHFVHNVNILSNQIGHSVRVVGRI